MTILVLAGGLATRLRPITENIPKAMININGYPFIHHQVLLFVAKGATHIHLCLGYLGQIIENYVKINLSHYCKFTFSYDGEKLLGTGGAIVNSLCYLPEFFFVTYGDSYLDIDYNSIISFSRSRGNACVMTVYKNNNYIDQSNVVYKYGVLLEYSKTEKKSSMDYIDYGLLYLEKKYFLKKEHIKFDLADILSNLVKGTQILGFEVFDRFYEIGSLAGIREFENFKKKQNE